MTMHRVLSVLAIGAVLAGCETAPTTPTVIEAPRVPPVSTAAPYVWDSADELAPWVSNGVSTGSISVVGDGTDAVIRVDVAAGPGALHGPDLDPAIGDVQSARMRYRWVDHDQVGSLQITMYLRPPDLSPTTVLPRLVPPTGGATELRTGAWLEKTLTSSVGPGPPYPVRYGFIVISRSGAGTHGAFEIDWIALRARQETSTRCRADVVGWIV